ncbi:MAG: sugar phosphate isomerase/epimerase [Clostridia bacterium]|nr:sugar phosphate isomerase/epimerase [Clostridia bacterium]
MKISTQTARLGERFGDKKAVQMLCDIGFDAIDYSMFQFLSEGHILNSDGYRQHVTELRKIAEGNGVYFNQTHAPFPSYIKNDEEYNKKILPALVRSIEITAILGAKDVVIHPVAVKENQKEFNIALYNSLLPYAKEYGVRIALENMFGWDPVKNMLIENVCSREKEFNDYLDALDRDYFIACLDIGHCGLIGGYAPDMIRALGHDRLKSLHVHDNDNISDLHTLPFTQRLNWIEIMSALKDISYDGELTFEADNFLTNFPDELMFQATTLILETGKHLVSLFEG